MTNYDFYRNPPAWMTGVLSSRRRRSVFFLSLSALLVLFFMFMITVSSVDKDWKDYNFKQVAKLKKPFSKEEAEGLQPQGEQKQLKEEVKTPFKYKPLKHNDLLRPDFALVREQNETTLDYPPNYTFVRHLGRGAEGMADIYVDQQSGQEVVIKTFFGYTRTQDTPPDIQDRLMQEYNITLLRWPVDLQASIRRYDANDPFAPDLTVHPIDAFYIPNTNASEPQKSDPLTFRMVLPLFPHGSIDHLQETVAYLNLTTADVDFLYRSRYRKIFETLGKMHTTKELKSNVTDGFCHDDIKLDNLFVLDEKHTFLVGDLGQTRSLHNDFHRNWRDCRLVDAHRAWKSYLILLRDSAARNGTSSDFDEPFESRTSPWAKAYWQWLDTDLTLPQHMLGDHEFWDREPLQQKIMFPQWVEGKVVRVRMDREQAIAAMEKIREELARYKQAVQRVWLAVKVKQEAEEKKKAEEAEAANGKEVVGDKLQVEAGSEAGDEKKETGAAAGVGAGTGAGVGTGVEAGAGAKVEAGPGAGVEVEAKVGSGAVAGAGTTAEAGVAVGAEAGVAVGAEVINPRRRRMNRRKRQTAETQSTEVKSTETQSTEAQSTEDQSTGSEIPPMPEKPWFYWDLPAKAPANEPVEIELKVINGAKLIGLTGT